jgi:hypothetical protein
MELVRCGIVLRNICRIYVAERAEASDVCEFHSRLKQYRESGIIFYFLTLAVNSPDLVEIVKVNLLLYKP